MKDYIENIKEYQEILKKCNIDLVNINILQIFIYWQTINDFKDFMKTSYLSYLLKCWEKENIEFFFWEEWIIKDKKELCELINHDKRKYIVYLWEYWDEEIIEFFFWEKWIIKDTDSLLELMNHDKLDDINYWLRYWQKENIELLFWEYWITKNINNLIELMNNAKWNNINYLLEFWKKKSIELLFWEHWIIKNNEDLFKIMNASNFIHIKSILDIDYSSNDILKLEYLLNFSSKRGKKGYNIDILDNDNNIWVCASTEDYNLKILLWLSDNFLSIYIGKKNIWIVKRDWERTFLSFEDIFDNKWNLFFLKWFIYYLEIDWERMRDSKYINDKKIDFLDFKWTITRNPIRKIKEFHSNNLEEKYGVNLFNDYDELVENFRG